MPEPTAEISLACAAVLLDELARGGVEHVCVSPGSRSTPLALAASRTPRLTLHTVLDERSAGFVALGIARATGRPAVAICTSGTAVANWLPAVVEADADRVPLILLSADRPPELRQTGANQTIDQTGIFGGRTRLFVEAGLPEATPAAGRYWRSLGSRAVAAVSGPAAGAVHLNLPLREPLVPGRAAVDLGPDAAGRSDGAPWERTVPAERSLDSDTAGELLRLLATERGLLVAGPATRPLDPGLIELASAAGWPVIADPLSGLRRPGALSAGTALAAQPGFRESHRPAVVLQVGAAPTSRGVAALVASAPRLCIVDADSRHADPGRHAGLTLDLPAAALVQTLLPQMARSPQPSAWLQEWTGADARARTAIDSLLDGWHQASELRTARDLAATLPDDALLFAGSSMPVRDLDAVMAPRHGLRVCGNRGASGIDGAVSTVLGLAHGSGRPVWALLGDLTLLHDSGALLWPAARSGCDVTIVVLNNGGGGIFTLLDQARLPAAERDLFETPHGVDIAALCAAAGVDHLLVEESASLTAAAGAPGRGVRIVEVRSDRQRNAAEHAQLAAAVAGALQPSPSTA